MNSHTFFKEHLTLFKIHSNKPTFSTFLPLMYLPKNNRKASMPAKMNTSMTSAGKTLSAQGRVSSTSSSINSEVTPDLGKLFYFTEFVNHFLFHIYSKLMINTHFLLFIVIELSLNFNKIYITCTSKHHFPLKCLFSQKFFLTILTFRDFTNKGM